MAGDTYVSAQLSNASTVIFWIDELRFEPVEPLKAARLSSSSAGFEGLSLEDANVYIGLPSPIAPRCSYQFVFRVYSNDNSTPAGPLGRLDIHWRTADGQTGHLQTGTITTVTPAAITLDSLSMICRPASPDALMLCQPGNLELELRNNTPRVLSDIFVGFDLNSANTIEAPLIPIGELFTCFKSIEPGAIKTVRLGVIPTRQGFIQCSHFVVGYTDEWVKQRAFRKIILFVNMPLITV